MSRQRLCYQQLAWLSKLYQFVSQYQQLPRLDLPRLFCFLLRDQYMSDFNQLKDKQIIIMDM